MKKLVRCLPAGMFLLPLIFLTACGEQHDVNAATVEAVVLVDSTTTAPLPTEVEPPAEEVGPVTDLPPNELGEILVLEYHRLGEKEGEFVRRAENFRKDLETLYQRGYRPITMRQLLDGDVDLPAGTTPVVFTIDDSSLGQFYYREDGSIDPATMMGMWQAFAEASPGWKHGARLVYSPRCRSSFQLLRGETAQGNAS